MIKWIQVILKKKFPSAWYSWKSWHIGHKLRFENYLLQQIASLKDAQEWEFRSYRFLWFLYHKVFLGRRLGNWRRKIILYLVFVSRRKILKRMLSILLGNILFWDRQKKLWRTKISNFLDLYIVMEDLRSKNTWFLVLTCRENPRRQFFLTLGHNLRKY